MSADPALAELAYIHGVLRVLQGTDCEDDLFWRLTDGHVTIAVNCSDMFWWGTADAEPIEPGDIDALGQAAEDATTAGIPYFADALFAARKRAMRPQDPWSNDLDGAGRALFDACGPYRTRAEQG